MEAEGNRACVQVFVGPVGRISIKIRSVNVAVQSARTPFFSSSSSAFDDTHMKQGKNKKKKGKNVEWAHPPASVRTDPKAISKERKNCTPRDPLVVRWGNAASSSSKKKKTKTDRQKNWETPDYDTYSSFFFDSGWATPSSFFQWHGYVPAGANGRRKKRPTLWAHLSAYTPFSAGHEASRCVCV